MKPVLGVCYAGQGLVVIQIIIKVGGGAPRVSWGSHSAGPFYFPKVLCDSVCNDAKEVAANQQLLRSMRGTFCQNLASDA